VLTRGGGGLEDLHAFNDEQVARAVFGSSIPVVVAVGHERDESLADYVADVRASTPSNAVERVVPSRNDVLYEIETMARHMQDQIDNTISEKGRLIEHATNLVSFVLERQKERFRVIYDQLMVTTGDWLPLIRSDLEGLGKILRQVDPKRVLARGYSLVTVGGAVVTKASELEVGQDINVQFATGSADAQVKRVDGKGQQRLV
jgi:exodeoxyribonuclease VII large subunit